MGPLGPPGGTPQGWGGWGVGVRSGLLSEWGHSADHAALLPADYLYDEPYCFWNNTKDPDCKMYRLLRTKTDAIHAQHESASCPPS